MAAGLTLGQWVATIRQTAAGDAPNVTLVAGNEASDADSIVTAQVYGYLKQQTAAEGDGPVVPVVMCNREDVALRKETTILLESCGVDYNNLVFLDDPGTDKLLARVKTVTLVDHNKAMGLLDALSDRVVEIKDHHKDLGGHPNASGDARMIAFDGAKGEATAASACSVIAEAYLASARGRELLALDNGAAARALLGVILIDSVNLDPAAKKVCPRDSAAAAEMMKFAPSPSQNDLYHSLIDAKFDIAFWESLTIYQCARYDYKQFTTNGKTYGISSCLCSLEVLSKKEGFATVAAKRAGALDLYGILTQVKPKGSSHVERQVMLYASDAAVTAQAAEFAQAYNSPSLQLEPMELAGLPNVRAFHQKNVAASRKQVQPCLGAFFTSAAAAPAAEVGVVGGMLAGLRQQVTQNFNSLSEGVQARVEQARAGNRMLDEGGPEVEAKLLAKKTHTDALELHEEIVAKLEEAAKMYADAAEKLKASAPNAASESPSFASLAAADAERAQIITKALEALNDIPEETTISDVEQDAITLLIAKGHYRFAVAKTGEHINAAASAAGEQANALKVQAQEKAAGALPLSPRPQ